MIAGAVMGVFLLLLGQFLVVNEPTRFYMNAAEKLEGQVINFYDEFPETRLTSTQYIPIFATITLEIDNFTSLEKAVLLINGREVTDFREKQVTAKVLSGDVLAVDGTFYDHEIYFRILSTSENVAEPRVDHLFRVRGDIVTIGKVQLI